jgi:hypothetical protein
MRDLGWLCLVASVYCRGSCCFNGSAILEPQLCAWLQASGSYSCQATTSQEESTPYCQPAACDQTRVDGSSKTSQLSLWDCWNSNTSDFLSVSLECGDGPSALWTNGIPAACCYVIGGQAFCSEQLMTQLQCWQQHNGVSVASCDDCVSQGACVTGLQSCSDTFLPECVPQPSVLLYDELPQS